jgi:hypothetical protein
MSRDRQVKSRQHVKRNMRVCVIGLVTELNRFARGLVPRCVERDIPSVTMRYQEYLCPGIILSELD